MYLNSIPNRNREIIMWSGSPAELTLKIELKIFIAIISR